MGGKKRGGKTVMSSTFQNVMAKGRGKRSKRR
jgi:hypothetical protein